MATLPKVFGGVGFAQFPVTRQIVFDTRIDVAPNGSEQRFVNNVPLFRFVFPYNSLLGADQIALLNFFNARAGMNASDWTAAMLAQTYANLTFDDDTISLTQQDPLLWNVALKFHQTQNKSYTIPSPTNFPNLSSGKPFQRPYGPQWRSLTVAGDSTTGSRYAYQFYGAGLSNFPSSPLRGWTLSYPVLSDADVATIENFFVGSQGRFATFSLTDDTSTTYAHCRFATDVLSLQYVAPNQTNVQFSIQEFCSIT